MMKDKKAKLDFDDFGLRMNGKEQKPKLKKVEVKI